MIPDRHKLDSFGKKLYRWLFWLLLEKPVGALVYVLPVKPNRVIFDNFGGNGFGDNPKYIAQALHRLAPDLEMIWLEDNLRSLDFPEYIRPVKVDSIRALCMRSTARVWVDNVRHLHPVKKKKNQLYLQTWHAPFGPKLAEADAASKLGKDYVRQAIYDGTISDGILVDSKLQEEQFLRAFWLGPQTEILRFGLPRNDNLIRMAVDPNAREKALQKLGLKPGDYHVLYAPTFRDDRSTKGYALDFARVLQAFEKTMGQPCKLIIRLHPNVAFQKKTIPFTEKILDGTDYPDMQMLSLACDAVISDYSSSVYDFAMLHKPVFVCALDLEDYEKTRGLLKDFYTMPFPMARTNGELIDNIRKYGKEAEAQRVEAYFAQYPFYDRGDAAEQSAQWILNKIRQ